MISAKSMVIYPESPERAKLVHRAYEEWTDKLDETSFEFINRKKGYDLSLLLNEVIENELSETEKTVVRLYWFDGLKSSVISNELNQNRSTVSRTLERANAKIYDSLKYVVRYQYDMQDDEYLPLAVKRAFSCLAAKAYEPETVGERITMLRNREEISIFSLAKAICIDPQRLFAVECGQAKIDIDMLIALSGFFCVGTDFILFGRKGETDGKIAI